MAKKKKEAINLLPQEEFAASTLGRIITWLLSTFRMIVIATEMVVMAAFLSRFWLDARNADLNDAIKQKQAVVISYKSVEQNFRAAQSQLALYSALNANTFKNTPAISTLITALPAEIVLTNISVDTKSIQAKGTAPGENSIAQFLTNIGGLSQNFKNPALSELQSSQTGSGLDFIVQADIIRSK